jgi:hypothetical protein
MTSPTKSKQTVKHILQVYKEMIFQQKLTFLSRPLSKLIVAEKLLLKEGDPTIK